MNWRHYLGGGGGGMLFFFCIFFASVLPSVSFYCGNPWTSLCHMHHFDRGGGWQMHLFVFFCMTFFFAVSTCTPPPPALTGGAEGSGQ